MKKYFLTFACLASLMFGFKQASAVVPQPGDFVRSLCWNNKEDAAVPTLLESVCYGHIEGETEDALELVWGPYELLYRITFLPNTNDQLETSRRFFEAQAVFSDGSTDKARGWLEFTYDEYDQKSEGLVTLESERFTQIITKILEPTYTIQRD